MPKHFKIKLNFRIQYKTEFGDAVFVTGNCKELGKWKSHKSIRLVWTENDYWEGEVVLKLNAFSTLEFKYFIGAYSLPLREHIIWENGPNRTIKIDGIQQQQSLRLDDIWNHWKVNFSVLAPEQYDNLYIVGDDLNQNPILGSIKQPILLKKTKKILNGLVCWEKTINIDTSLTNLRYKYMVIDQQDNMNLMDRKTRSFDWERAELIENRPNCYSKHDDEIKLDFTFNQIDDNIFVGPYPQNERDVKSLAKKGINVVLNLMTQEEMNRLGIDLRKIVQIYQNNTMIMINYDIIDMDLFDMTAKITQAAEILQLLIKKFQKVYIHCAAGIFRSPSIIVRYYQLVKKYSLSESVKLIEEKRPQCKQNRRLARLCQELIYHFGI